MGLACEIRLFFRLCYSMCGTGASSKVHASIHWGAESPVGIAAVEMRAIRNSWQKGSFGADCLTRLFDPNIRQCC